VLFNKSVFNLVLNVLKESHDCRDSGRLFQTTDYMYHIYNIILSQQVIDYCVKCVHDVFCANLPMGCTNLFFCC